MEASRKIICPLCEGEELIPVGELTGQQLCALWKALDCEFSTEAWGAIHDAFRVVRQRCARCEFEFFDPHLAGNEAFYHQLERPGYYSPSRLEFARTLQFARKNRLRRVLDVGCGVGLFLDQARQAGCETCGVELSRAAGEKARANGHRIFDRLLGDLDLHETGGGFDLITLFQVVEHLPKPVETMREAAALLNPGGCISVAVPSAAGVYRWVPWDPHQWPPHHVSRWLPKDFDQLAKAVPLRLVERGGDILVGSQLEYFWKLHNRLAPALGKPARWGGDDLPRIVSFFFRKTGMKFVFPRWGCSIYAYFQKPYPRATCPCMTISPGFSAGF